MANTFQTTAAASITQLFVRTQVVQRAGRYDLVGTKTENGQTVPDYAADRGVDVYIAEGLAMVCDRAPWLLVRREYSFQLAAGEYEVAVPRLRQAESLRSDGPLDELTYECLLDQYGPFEDAAPGAPAAWAEAVPEHSAAVTGSARLVVMPPPCADAEFVLLGTFYPDPYASHDVTSDLTLIDPFVLIKAALVAVAMAYGGAVEERQRDFELAIKPRIHDRIEAQLRPMRDSRGQLNLGG